MEKNASIEVNKKAKKWGIIAGLVISLPIAILVGYMSIKSMYLNPDTIVDVFKDCFMDGDPYPPTNSAELVDDNWILISVNATNEEDALIKLKKTYNKLSNKLKTKRIEKVIVSISKYSGADWGFTKKYEPGEFMFASEIWISDLKETNWGEIKTYGEFKEKANVFTIDLD